MIINIGDFVKHCIFPDRKGIVLNTDYGILIQTMRSGRKYRMPKQDTKLITDKLEIHKLKLHFSGNK